MTRCKLRLNVRDSFLEVQLHCKHGVVKTHKLHIEDADSIQAVYDALVPTSPLSLWTLAC